MSQKSRDRIQILVRKEADGRLSPIAPIDVETIDNYPPGTEFEIRAVTRRSLPQLKLYWAVLADVVRRTGKWPTPEHLSDALKQACGYLTVNYDLAGRPYTTTDSIAFDAMNQAEFQVYFNQSTAELSRAVGYDVLAGYEESARARLRS